MNTTTDNRDVILNSDVIILAVKPYQVLGIMSDIQSMFGDFQSRAQPHSSPKSWRPLIVSVASSVTISDIEQKVHTNMYNVLNTGYIAHVIFLKFSHVSCMSSTWVFALLMYKCSNSMCVCMCNV